MTNEPEPYSARTSQRRPSHDRSHTGGTIAQELGWRAEGLVFARCEVPKGLHLAAYGMQDGSGAVCVFVQEHQLRPEGIAGTPPEALADLVAQLRTLRDRINATLAALEGEK